jgi:hypothetical protein
MSMPSLDFFKSTPESEMLKVESEPPGADVRTTQGQSCRTPCELSVSGGGEMSVSFELNGYQPQTVQVRAEGSSGGAYGESSSGPPRLQPNPVFAELQPMKPAPAAKKKAPARKKTAAKKKSETVTEPATSEPGGSSPSATEYPWPEPR